MVEKKENGDIENEEKQITDWDLPLTFTKNRHTDVIEGVNAISQTWRMKERMKTVSVALVLCLNVGVDPPDIVKTQPCARLECWIDPLSMSPPKALETIGTTLQKQYERWQPRARYKQSLDPTVEEVKKLCTSLRRNAKEERVLFHYNGHGVPKPTVNGEIWVFNRTYTQYIPLSVYDLQTWMGAPSIYVYDCSCSGIIVESFKAFAEQHKNEYEMQKQTSGGRAQSPSPPSYHNCIQLAACGANQILPMNPDLPADIFTSCLTTPIKVALRWYVMQNTAKLVPKITLDLVDKIPGQLNDRRTMLGELNWIFTAITDTIAWNTLPRDLFQKLFRQDLLVASLFRNFLLAERILRSYDCTPVSSPALPPTYQHPMWQAWDLALDLSLSQLPGILSMEEQFQHLPFFEEQLTAFQVWLTLGSENRNPPEQLPIVLQVLLSQVHRLRALELLGRFLDLGPWAVNLALSVGIFPYVLKLLQSSAKELRPLLVFIWAKILAVDSTCQADLVRDNGHKYFLSVLQDPIVSSEHRTLSAFVLASIVHEYPPGQKAALQGSLVSICLEQLGDSCRQLRQWLAICLARLWDNYEKARWTGVRDIAHEKLYTLLQDPSPEVRAAAVYALGTFINSVTERSEHANNIDHTIAMTLLNTVTNDMSCLVRQELVVALQWIVLLFESSFLSVAMHELAGHGSPHEIMSPVGMRRTGSRDRITSRMLSPQLFCEYDSPGDKLKRVSSSSSISSMGMVIVHHPGMGPGSSLGTLPTLAYGSVYMKLWHGLGNLDSDPHPSVAQMSQVVTGHIRNQVKEMNTLKELNDANRLTSSVSLPPSPNRGNFLTGESPPTLHPNAELPRLGNRTPFVNRTRKIPNTINEDSDENQGIKKPLVQTQFVAWACKHFAQPVMKESEHEDVESPIHYEREWRYMRNAALRREARDEQERIGQSRIEMQVFNTRNPYTPSVVQFHPYDQQIAVAGRDSFGIWDWGTGAKLAVCQSRGSKGGSKLTALEWINGHDVALLMAAADDGTIKIWRPMSSVYSREPVLVSAWHALTDMQSNARTNSDIWDWGTGAKLAVCQSRGSKGGSKLTALEWINGHDVALLMAAADDGTIKIWRPMSSVYSREPVLVSAWHALTDMQSNARTNTLAGMMLSWEQWTQTVITSGDVRIIRLWDAEKELKYVDMPTGADCSVSCIDSTYSAIDLENYKKLQSRCSTPDDDTGLFMKSDLSAVDSVDSPTVTKHGLITIGCADGSVRLFDRRLSPAEARIRTWREHSTWVIDVQLRGEKIISGSSSGEIKMFDIRMNNPLSSCQVMNGMNCLTIHRNADTYACGSLHPTISVHNFAGQTLNTIRFYEGFMGHRIGSVSCLAYHPHRMALAAGTSDSTVSVYSVEQRR